MSKGYGARQRLILDKLSTLDKNQFFSLQRLLPPSHKAKEYQALHRAARTLQKAGKVSIDYISYDVGLGIHHPRTEIVTIANPKAGQRRADGFYEIPLLVKCILRDKCPRVDTYSCADKVTA